MCAFMFIIDLIYKFEVLNYSIKIYLFIYENTIKIGFQNYSTPKTSLQKSCHTPSIEQGKVNFIVPTPKSRPDQNLTI